MNSQLDDQTAELLGGVDEIIVAVRGGLGELDTSQLLGLRDWIKDMDRLLKRLDDAIAVVLPLAELQDQIAVAEATDRLAQERERVAKAKAIKMDRRDTGQKHPSPQHSLEEIPLPAIGGDVPESVR